MAQDLKKLRIPFIPSGLPKNASKPGLRVNHEPTPNHQKPPSSFPGCASQINNDRPLFKVPLPRDNAGKTVERPWHRSLAGSSDSFRQPASWNQNSVCSMGTPAPSMQTTSYLPQNDHSMRYPYNINDYQQTTPIHENFRGGGPYDSQRCPTSSFKTPVPRDNPDRNGEHSCLPSGFDSFCRNQRSNFYNSTMNSQSGPIISARPSAVPSPALFRNPDQVIGHPSFGNGLHHSTPMHNYRGHQSTLPSTSSSNLRSESQFSGLSHRDNNCAMRIMKRLETLFLEKNASPNSRKQRRRMLDELWECVPQVQDELSRNEGSLCSFQSNSIQGSARRNQYAGSVRSMRSNDTVSSLFSLQSNDTSIQKQTNSSDFVCSIVFGSRSRKGSSHIASKDQRQPARTKNISQLTVPVANNTTVLQPCSSTGRKGAVQTPASTIVTKRAENEAGVRSEQSSTEIELYESTDSDDEMLLTVKKAQKERKRSRLGSRPTAIHRLLDLTEGEEEGHANLQTNVNIRGSRGGDKVRSRKNDDLELLVTPYEEKSLLTKARRKLESKTVTNRTKHVVTKSKSSRINKNTTIREELTTTTTTTSVVCVTRSGRSIKPPAFYHDTSSATLKQITYSSPSRSPKSNNTKKKTVADAKFKVPVKPPPRISRRKPTKDDSKITESSKATSKTGRKRARNDSSALSSASEKELKENMPPMVTAAKNKRNVKAKRSSPKSKGKTKDLKLKTAEATVETGNNGAPTPGLGPFAFGGDLFVPEVSSAARKGGAKGRALNTVGSVTPPLHYFTANINPSLIGSETPFQATPDWHVSQRSPSEVKGLQKRKAESKKTKTKPPSKAEKKKPGKPTKAVSETMKLICDPKLSARKLRQLTAPVYYSDSETE